MARSIALVAVVGLSGLAALSMAAQPKPHIVMHLVDDWGWANAGWHSPGNPEVKTPRMDELVRSGIELDRAYSYQFCSPTRSSLQSGRYPTHVNDKNMDVTVHNPSDPMSGFAGIPRNMTGIASKLKQAGYLTHQVGKWDAGMATWDHTPRGRGYDTSFGYFHHDNGYFNEKIPNCPQNPSVPDCYGPIVDLWDTTRPAYGVNSSCEAFYRQGNMTHGCEQPGPRMPLYTVGPEMIYEEKLFVDRCLQIVDEHPSDPETPLFLNYDSHIVHTPLQAPAPLYHSFDFMDNDWDHHRQIYASMVSYLDTGVGKIVDALKDAELWDNTIWFCQSDNGGPSFTGDNHTANNYPLRGAKYSNWEGGVRVNAFVSGGYLAKVAPQRVGSKLEGFLHVCDYYATFAYLAGVDPTDERAAAAGLPPVDGVNMWPYLSGQVATSPRTEVWNDIGVLTMGQYKLYNASGPYGSLAPDGSGDAVQQYGCFPGVVFPNATTDYYGPGWITKGPAWKQLLLQSKCVGEQRCPNGACLYDIFADPTEHDNLSGDPAMAPKIQAMRERLAQLEATYFNPKRGTDDGLAVQTAQTMWKGYWGPFVFP